MGSRLESAVGNGIAKHKPIDERWVFVLPENQQLTDLLYLFILYIYSYNELRDVMLEYFDFKFI